MNLQNARVVLTGASGGIGNQTALMLSRAGARLVLVDRNAETLDKLCADIRGRNRVAFAVAADLTNAEGRRRVVEQTLAHLGGVDVLVNLAGLLNFNPFETEDPVATERLLQVNITAPILLTQAILPHMLQQKHGRVVNIGSTFGSIAFPYFAAYSASKFALRGFSEALRRELDGTGVSVTYIAPRATRTALNTSAVNRMNEALKINMDSPETVAMAIVRAIHEDRADVYLGWPERLFVRLNAILPRLVDKSLRKQNRDMRKYATES